MKTYEDFRTAILKSEAFGKMTIQELETTASKEYAKQWIHEFALQTFHHLDARSYNDLLTQLQPEIIKRIEEQ